MIGSKWVAVPFLGLLACAPVSQVNGAALMIDFSPVNRPAMVGALDFDLLPSGTGKACIERNSVKQYWVRMEDVAKLSNDALTRQAIAAAITDAAGRLEDVDGILLTRVVTESRGADHVCAVIAGRGVRLTKAHAQATAPERNVAPEPAVGSDTNVHQ